VKWASSLAAGANLSDAVVRGAAAIRAKLGPEPPDLVLAFASYAYRDSLPHLPALLQEHLPSRVLAGCNATGVIGGGEEIEDAPALSICAASLPGVDVSAVHRPMGDPPDEDAPPTVWRAWLGVAEAPAAVIALADPFTTRMETLTTGLDYALPGVPKIGGLISGGTRAGENALWAGNDVRTQGAIFISLSGAIAAHAAVAQGCRPVGRVLTVTKCEQNVLLEVDHEPPLRYLAALVETLDEPDRQLMRNSLFLGIEMDPLEREPHAGDFLIRNLVGIDYQAGRLAASTLLRPGQRIQFHLRDRTTSIEDLDRTLAATRDTLQGRAPAGALLFSCVGRGSGLYRAPGYESRRCEALLGGPAPAGFFCNGEIGPVGGATYLHGYTSCIGLFRARKDGETR